MARIAGVDIPRNKRVEISLTYIYGIGRTSSKQILEHAEVNPDTRVRDPAEAEVTRCASWSRKSTRWRASCAAKSR